VLAVQTVVAQVLLQLLVKVLLVQTGSVAVAVVVDISTLLLVVVVVTVFVTSGS
jgi:hypothetical protein